MLLTETCYYLENQVLGGVTNWDMSLIEKCFYSQIYGIQTWFLLYYFKFQLDADFDQIVPNHNAFQYNLWIILKSGLYSNCGNCIHSSIKLACQGQVKSMIGDQYVSSSQFQAVDNFFCL